MSSSSPASATTSIAALALVELQKAGVRLDRLKRIQGPTGVALITVDASGENEIVVAPGANLQLRPEDLDLGDTDAVLCQLEIPLETVERAAELAPDGFFLNAAPARGPYPAADVTIVNRFELDALPQRDGVVAVTLGAEGAVLLEDGKEVARASRRRSRRSTAPPRATRSPRASSSRCSRGARARRRSGAHASPARSRRRASARRRRCRPRRKWTRLM